MAIELGWFFDANEREASTAKEFFHILRVAADVVFRFCTVVELDGADGAQGTFVTEDEVDGFVFNETVSFVAILAADFVAQEGRKTNIWDDVEALAEDIVKELEAVFLAASHELLTRAIMEAIEGVATTTLGGDHNKNREYEEDDSSNTSDSDKNCVHDE